MLEEVRMDLAFFVNKQGQRCLKLLEKLFLIQLSKIGLNPHVSLQAGKKNPVPHPKQRLLLFWIVPAKPS